MFLKFLQNSLKNIKNIRDAVFNLNFQTKRSITLLKGDFGTCAFPENFVEVSRTPIFQNADRLLFLKHLLKTKIAALDKFLIPIRTF